MLPSLKTMKTISLLAGPMVMIRVLYTLVNVVGMILISRIGHQEFASGALITALLNTLVVIAMSPIISVGIIASRYFGSEQHEQIGQLLRTSFFISTAISIIVFTLLWNISFFLTLFKQPESLIPYVSSYCRIIAWSILPSLLIANINQFCFATRRQNLVFFYSAILLIATIFLGTCLLYGYLGLPALGMTGWAYAITITNWAILVSVLIYIIRNKKFKPYKLINGLPRVNKNELKMIRRIGVPITIQISSELIIFSTMNLMVGWLGVEALSVQQIILQSMLLTLMIPMGAGQGSAMLIGQAIGKKQMKEVSEICISGTWLVLIFMAIVCTLYIAFPDLIISLFIKSSQTKSSFISLAKHILVIAAISQTADALRNVQIGFLRGLHDMWRPVAATVAILAISLPVAYFLAFNLSMGLVGISLGYAIAFIISAALIYLRLKKQLKPYQVSDGNGAFMKAQ